jgi:hypothetical protein
VESFLGKVKERQLRQLWLKRRGGGMDSKGNRRECGG